MPITAYTRHDINKITTAWITFKETEATFERTMSDEFLKTMATRVMNAWETLLELDKKLNGIVIPLSERDPVCVRAAKSIIERAKTHQA